MLQKYNILKKSIIIGLDESSKSNKKNLVSEKKFENGTRLFLCLYLIKKVCNYQVDWIPFFKTLND